MLKFLYELEGSNDPTALSVYILPGLSITAIEDLLVKAEAQSLPIEVIQLAANSKNGSAILWGNTRKCLILPPFPFRETATFTGYTPEPLCLLLNSDFKIGFILVHLGAYAIGICRGENLFSSKVGTGLVHGRHKKGGSSQQRFQRRRQNQAQEFLDRVCMHIMEQFEPEAQFLNYVVYGGPHQTILLLKKRCLFLKSFEDRLLPLMEVPLPRHKVLEMTVSRVWSSRIIEWQEE
jgi:peptide subunit release factor 1 (eRF1)